MMIAAFCIIYICGIFITDLLLSDYSLESYLDDVPLMITLFWPLFWLHELINCVIKKL